MNHKRNVAVVFYLCLTITETIKKRDFLQPESYRQRNRSEKEEQIKRGGKKTENSATPTQTASAALQEHQSLEDKAKSG